MAQMFEYMVDKGKDAYPFNDDVKKLTGQHGSFEQFALDHKSQLELEKIWWFTVFKIKIYLLIFN